MVGLSLIYLYNFICIGVLLRNSNCFKLDSYFFLCIMRCRLLRLRKSSARCDFNLQLFSCKNVCCFCCFSLLLLFPSCNLCLVLFVFFSFCLSHFVSCILYFSQQSATVFFLVACINLFVKWVVEYFGRVFLFLLLSHLMRIFRITKYVVSNNNSVKLLAWKRISYALRLKYSKEVASRLMILLLN